MKRRPLPPSARPATAAAVLCLCLTPWAGAQNSVPRASVELLPTLGGNFSAARGLNDRGQVVGTSSDGTHTRGFVWQAGSGMQAVTAAGTAGEALAINNAGQVVGSSTLANRPVPYLWTPTTGLRPLAAPSGEPVGKAYALNELGVAAGYWSGPVVDRGVRWGNDGSVLELQPTNNLVFGINDAGQMVGSNGGPGTLWQADGTAVPLPSLDATRPLMPRDINNHGVVVGSGRIDNSFTTQAFVWQASTGMRNLGHLGGGASAALAINDFGQVVGSSRLAGGTGDVVMLWREGAGMSNLSALAGAGVNPYEAFGINAHAQVAGTASTAAGNRAFLMTLHPDWAGGDGAWDDSSGQRWNWAGTGTAAARVGAMHDVVIDPGRSATVLGSAEGNARTLRIGGTAGHLVTLDLNGGSTRLGDGQANVFSVSVIGAGGVLRGPGRLESTDDLQVRSGGRIEAGAGQRLQLAVAYLDNQGVIRAQGTAFQSAVLEVSGGAFYNQAGAQLQLVQADAVLASGLVNFGQVSLQNAQMTLPQNPAQGQLFNAAGASVAVSFGASVLNGKLTNQGLVVVSNGAQASFHGAVVNAGELRVSSGGAANFFGLVSGTGAITGAGEVRFEGGLSVGASPAAVQIDPEAVISSVVTMELGGSTPGDGDGHHDQISFTRAVTLDGATLSLQWWGGHAAGVGAVYDLFDWNGGVSGSFAAVDLPTLGAGLAWNTTDLYAGGTLRVSAVPEPQTWALFGSGLALLGWLTRRRGPAGLAA